MSRSTAQPLTAYADDIYAWSQEQAGLLRALTTRRLNLPLDLENLAEEIEDLGREQLRAAQSLTVRILEHLLKLAYSPAATPRLGWMRTVAAARGELQRRLTRSIERQLREQLTEHYVDARRLADLALRDQQEDDAAAQLPVACPYSFDQVLQQDWYPSPDRGQDVR